MKLKRFLLRYDPPGIGLEVEDEGNCQVVHKDLPPAEQIQSITAVVDKLIAEECILLTKRRHHKALMQLLTRLYPDVEVEPTDEEDAGAGEERRPPKVAEQAPPLSGRSHELHEEGVIVEGQQVVLVGLKGKQQVHNGETGTVTKARGNPQTPQKFEVTLDREGEVVKVKGLEHLIPTAPKGTHLAVGTHVAIRGLRNHIELNGCLGRVVECHEESHRFEVRAAESGQLFRVKQENLIPIESIPSSVMAGSKENREPNTSKDAPLGGAASSSAPGNLMDNNAMGGDGANLDVFEVGSAVQLFGLKTAMSFNGQAAEVLSVDRVRCRYEIRLPDGSVKTIRAENVRLVAAPPKQSPRSKRKDKHAT